MLMLVLLMMTMLVEVVMMTMMMVMMVLILQLKRDVPDALGLSSPVVDQLLFEPFVMLVFGVVERCGAEERIDDKENDQPEFCLDELNDALHNGRGPLGQRHWI